MLRTRIFTTLAAVTAAAALALTGCSTGSAPTVSPVPSSQRSSATAGAPADLAKFYNQTLTWKSCAQNINCAWLTVPVDYSDPGGATIQLFVDRYQSTGGSAVTQDLVVNPGGPGGSGAQYAAAAPQIVTSGVLQHYNVVGFDPRGVGDSDPIECYSDAQMDTLLGTDPTPDTTAEENATMASSKAFGDACLKKNPALLGHVSTLEVAKDLDILRAALSQPTLNYMGKSYGTLIGSTYAGLFPQKVGRFVLDGVVPPDLTTSQEIVGQAKGFQTATDNYVKSCIAQGSCPLGDTEQAALAKLDSFLKALDAEPLPVSGQGDVRELTEGWATLGIAYPMYSTSLWPDLTSALRQAFAGDGTGLMKLADQYADRDSDGSYSDNLMQVINAVNCLDRPGPSTVAQINASVPAVEKVSPTWGDMMAWGAASCAEWPIKPTGKAEKITAAGSGPILVVGTTGDPATPYEWSQQLAAELQNGHLLTYDGNGHTAYDQGNSGSGQSCVDDTVDAYLINGTVPATGKTC